MAIPMHRVKVAPKGMGLNDFVAMQEGHFAAEGLDVEFDWKTFRGTQSSWKVLEYLQRPQDRPYTQDKVDVIQGACVWGSICNASAGMGRFVADAYGVSPWAIFVRPDSRIRSPADLKDVPISVGMRAGSHFNVPYRLEKYLPLEHIKTVNTGGFCARCLTARSRPRACCRRRSRWPSSSACARSSPTRSIHYGGCRKARRRKSSPAICARSTAPKKRSTRILKNICRCGSSRCRRSS